MGEGSGAALNDEVGNSNHSNGRHNLYKYRQKEWQSSMISSYIEIMIMMVIIWIVYIFIVIDTVFFCFAVYFSSNISIADCYSASRLWWWLLLLPVVTAISVLVSSENPHRVNFGTHNICMGYTEYIYSYMFVCLCECVCMHEPALITTV